MSVSMGKLGNLFKIASVITGYWIISISMVFSNKYLVGNTSSEVDKSLLISWMQCVIATVFIVLLHLMRYFLNCSNTTVVDLQGWNAREVLLMTVTFICMLTFNNLCLQHVGVAFFQMARSTTILFVVFFSVTLLQNPVSIPVILSCLCIAVGFVLGIDQEKIIGSPSSLGIIFGVTTSFFAALNGIMTKKALGVVNHDTLQLTFLCNLNASVLFIPVLLIPGLLGTTLHMLERASFSIFLLFTGILGLSMGWISALQIDLTSPVTHHISANSKAIIQTCIAVVYHSEVKPFIWWISVFLVAAGATCYAILRLHEQNKGDKAESLSKP